MPTIQAWLIFYPFKRVELKPVYGWYVMLYKAHLSKGIVLLCCMATANIAMGHEELLQSTFFYDVHLAGVQICIIIFIWEGYVCF